MFKYICTLGFCSNYPFFPLVSGTNFSPQSILLFSLLVEFTSAWISAGYIVIHQGIKFPRLCWPLDMALLLSSSKRMWAEVMCSYLWKNSLVLCFLFIPIALGWNIDVPMWSTKHKLLVNSQNRSNLVSKGTMQQSCSCMLDYFAISVLCCGRKISHHFWTTVFGGFLCYISSTNTQQKYEVR